MSDGLARFTSEVRQADPQLRTLLTVVPPAVDQANTAFSGIRPSFPMLAANLANLGRVGVIYHKSIEQLLVVLPALFAAIITAANGEPQDEGAKLDFKINIDPPPCNTGFIPPPLIRTPADETLREIPTDMYCKTAQNDPATVRGARNYPCQEFPGKRAPTVALCRDPKGYVPIGTNPWRGPPIPYGTPMTNGLNILPPNKYPLHPAGQRPGSGNSDSRAASARCDRRARTGAAPAVPDAAAAQHRRYGWTAGVDSACALPAAEPADTVPEGRSRAATAGGTAGSAVPAARRSRGARRPARCRRPTARRIPPTTRAPAFSRTPPEALVSSRPARYRARRTGWT